MSNSRAKLLCCSVAITLAGLAGPGLSGLAPAQAAPPTPGKEAPDPCAESQAPQDLASTGLNLYRLALAQAEEHERARVLERSLRCFQHALAQSAVGKSKLYHPLGLVYERLGRPEQAIEALERFLAEVPEVSRQPGATKQVTDKLAALYSQVGRLQIDTVAGTEIRLDGIALGKAPLGRLIPVRPGAHAVAVGDSAAGAEVTVAAGQVRRVDLTGLRAPGAPRAFLLVRANRVGAAVHIDGQPAGTTPTPEVALVPGPHAVVARDGRQELRRGLSLVDGQHAALELHFPVQPWVWALVGVASAAVVGTAIGVGTYYGTSTPVPDGTVGGWR